MTSLANGKNEKEYSSNYLFSQKYQNPNFEMILLHELCNETPSHKTKFDTWLIIILILISFPYMRNT